MRVVPLEGNTLPFGVAVEDFDAERDLAELNALVLEKLGAAPLLRHCRDSRPPSVVVVRDQAGLSPAAQLALNRSFDAAATSYGHGSDQALLAASVLQSDLVPIPGVPQVKLLGNGLVESHEGLASVRLRHPQHFSFHAAPLSEKETAAGFTRFYRWHMDAALYGLHPPVVTSLLALEVPAGRLQTVRYDDGSGDTLRDVSLGTTAFVSGELAFAALSAEQQAFALRCSVRYAAHPYIWIKQAKAHPTGLGLLSQGLELGACELPPVEEGKVMTYPLVWRSASGKPSLQAHGCCLADLLVDGVPMGDLARAREALFELMRPGIAPKLVLAHEWRKGDLVLFSNRALWHTVVGTLGPEERRVYHQCNLAGSEAPEAYVPAE